jgi:hypothetical protein
MNTAISFAYRLGLLPGAAHGSVASRWSGLVILLVYAVLAASPTSDPSRESNPVRWF